MMGTLRDASFIPKDVLTVPTTQMHANLAVVRNGSLQMQPLSHRMKSFSEFELQAGALSPSGKAENVTFLTQWSDAT